MRHQRGQATRPPGPSAILVIHWSSARRAAVFLMLPTVIAEIGCMLQAYGSPDAEADFLKGVASGDFDPIRFRACGR